MFAMKRRLLVYESEDSGHRLQHPAFIANASRRVSTGFDELHLLVPKSFKERLLEYFPDFIESRSSVKISYIGDQCLQKFVSIKGIVARANAELEYIDAYVRENQITDIHLDCLNRFFCSWSKMRKLGVQYSGIYYSPYLRETAGSGIVNDLKFRLRRLRKVLILRLFLRWVPIRCVFVLNDQSVVTQLNKAFEVGLFRYIVDPVWENVRSDAATSGQLVGNAVRFLIFGTISKEKGVGQFVGALRLLSDELAGRMILRIAGRVRPEYQIEYEMQLQALVAAKPEIRVELENRFLSVDEVRDCFRSCDIVVNTNIRTQAASGVMGQAAAWGKPAITSSSGLYGELARVYQLGPVVDPYNSAEVCDACELILSGDFSDFDHRRAIKYCEERHWLCFAQTIFSDHEH